MLYLYGAIGSERIGKFEYKVGWSLLFHLVRVRPVLIDNVKIVNKIDIT